MGQKAFFQDMTRCTGCRCCQIACKDVNGLDVGYLFRKATDYEGGTFPQMWAATLSIACNHCDTPACMAVCPTGAIQKDTDTGLVVIDQTVCNGCQTCVTACPYGEPVYFADNNIVNKCDGCIDKVRNGEMPSCVAACSTRCLMFGEADDLRSTYSSQGGTSDLPVLPSSSMTGPNFIIMPVQGMVSQG